MFTQVVNHNIVLAQNITLLLRSAELWGFAQLLMDFGLWRSLQAISQDVYGHVEKNQKSAREPSWVTPWPS